MKTIKIIKKLDKYFVEMYIDKKVACVTQSRKEPRIVFEKYSNNSNGFVEVNDVILYFDKLEIK